MLISKIYKEKWDGVIYQILSEVFRCYKLIIEASGSISLVFAPGIQKIEFFTNQQVSLGDFHKDIFEDVFIKDNFIRVSIIFSFLNLISFFE